MDEPPSRNKPRKRPLGAAPAKEPSSSPVETPTTAQSNTGGLVGEPRRPIIMVSSTVDGIEDLLEQIFAILNARFTVWMSYKGTVPVDSQKSNFDNCLQAVERCDLFLGILTTSYGSGRYRNELSITHQEMRAALKRDIPRWFLAHRDLEFAYDLVRNLGYTIPESISELNAKMKALSERGRHPVIDDYRVLQIYSEVIGSKDEQGKPRGNWAQPFATAADARVFVVAQFLRYSQAVEEINAGPLSALEQMAETTQRRE